MNRQRIGEIQRLWLLGQKVKNSTSTLSPQKSSSAAEERRNRKGKREREM
jgi:hypothetical protein